MKILTKNQANFLRNFFQIHFKKDFFLTGGTALSAFYFYHRLSEDLDLFTINQTIDFNSVNAEMLKIIAKLKGKIEHQTSSGTFLEFIIKFKDGFLKGYNA